MTEEQRVNLAAHLEALGHPLAAAIVRGHVRFGENLTEDEAVGHLAEGFDLTISAEGAE